jgi:hypothetical protein
MHYTYDFAIDATPWRRPDVPLKIGRSAKRRPTAQS